MREKLIELFITEVGLTPTDAGIYADIFIERGVTISPCGIGDTVYVLYSRRLYKQRCGKYRRENVQIVTNGHLEAAKAQNAVEIREKKCSKNDVYLLGRLVFQTREEAERKIANDIAESD